MIDVECSLVVLQTLSTASGFSDVSIDGVVGMGDVDVDVAAVVVVDECSFVEFNFDSFDVPFVVGGFVATDDDEDDNFDEDDE